jgi:uncharacterized lipoprotein YddW (UPF0748 family)
MQITRRGLVQLAGSLCIAGCASEPLTHPAAKSSTQVQAVTRPVPAEWRAAWVATVANIDWPSRPGLDAATQISEIRQICDTAQRIGLHALIVQVRTGADALYASTLEPWSEYLTGTQGQHPGYDPLEQWLKEAHARGLELHAWINPYRARHSTARSEVASTHISRTKPGWVKTYGDQLWIDPGVPAAMDYTLAVVRDLLSRYAVDGIHIDDYFYPYPIQDSANQEVDFPDTVSWQLYRNNGGRLTRAAWRRDNVNRLVQQLYATAHQVRPGTRVGISPFGLQRPDLRPKGITGFSQYDKLYADVELWLREGWLDYLAPQLYWPRAQTAQAFDVLLQTWRSLNPLGRPIHPGLFTSRIDDSEKSWQAEEIQGQIDTIRRLSPGSGHIHFSMVALTQNRKGIADVLRQSYATKSPSNG